MVKCNASERIHKVGLSFHISKYSHPSHNYQVWLPLLSVHDTKYKRYKGTKPFSVNWYSTEYILMVFIIKSKYMKVHQFYSTKMSYSGGPREGLSWSGHREGLAGAAAGSAEAFLCQCLQGQPQLHRYLTQSHTLPGGESVCACVRVRDKKRSN